MRTIREAEGFFKGAEVLYGLVTAEFPPANGWPAMCFHLRMGAGSGS